MMEENRNNGFDFSVQTKMVISMEPAKGSVRLRL